MTDTDIPLVHGTPLPPVTAVPPPQAPSAPARDLRMATAINGGSSRVLLPTYGQESQPLSGDCLRALTEQGFTKGLAQALAKNKRALPLSIWVVDNSGSMSHRDGHRVVPAGKKKRRDDGVKIVTCTRWREMQQTVEYHAQMAALLKSPTVFRMLNDPGRVVGPQQFSVAERGDEYLDEDLALATSTIQNAAPSGVTPLVGHLREIRANVVEMEPNLRQQGSKVVIVLATDGIPTDERGYSNESIKRQFASTLRSFEGLHVWIVVRLCTDEEDVVDFWNNLDEQLELSLEVLDDFTAEAEEVHEHNKWLNYGLPLHRMREMGFHDKLFDLLDERMLSKDELRDFFRILFGDGMMDGVPEPEEDWDEFLSCISNLLANEKKQWNPISKRMEPWIDLKRLKKDYGPKGFLSMLW